LANPSDDLRGAAASLTRVGASELFVDARGVPQQALALWSGAVASAFLGRSTFLAEPATAAQLVDLLDSRASRVAVQDIALENPNVIAEVTRRCGPESLVVAIFARKENETWRVYRGRYGAATEWDAVTWARVAEAQGVCELIVETLQEENSGEPYDLDLLGEVARRVAVPVVAIGEPRSIDDCLDALLVGNADAVLLTPSLISGMGSLEAIRADLEEHGVSCR
jgi:cyclase